MSSAPTQIAVAPSASSLVAPAPQLQKDFLEEPLVRQNSLGNRIRGSLKGKHLTRSHAMRESASPPRTPTPRSDLLNASSASGHSSSTETINDSRVQAQSSPSATSSPPLDTQSVVIVSSQHSQQQQHQHHQQHTQHPQQHQQHHQQQQQQHAHHTQKSSSSMMYAGSGGGNSSDSSGSGNCGLVCNQIQLDVDFPKLTPPKSSKSPRNNNNNNNNRDSSTTRDKSMNANSVGGGNGNGNGDHNKSTNSVDPTSNGRNSNKNSNDCGNNRTMCHGNNGAAGNNNNNGINCNTQTGNNPSGHVAMTAEMHQTQLQQQTTGTTQTHPHPHHTGHHNLSPEQTVTVGGNSTVQQQQQQQQQQHQQQQQNFHQQHNLSQNHMSSSNASHLSYDKDNRCPRSSSGTGGNGNCGNAGGVNGSNTCVHSHDDSHNSVSESPTDGTMKCERLGKKHRSGANAKGSKPRLKNMGSSSSVEGGNSTSGFISRDNSMEQFTDQSGVDLVQFFKETLNKNPKDRSTLMKIEKDLIELAHDKTRTEIRFPAASSYNRMLIHRVAAFFGMEHNVDNAAQQCVIVATTKSTRIPDIRFKSLFRDRLNDEPRKSILKRDTHSFDDARQSGSGLLMCPVLDRKAKSFEEREEEYEKVRRRIFRGRECGEMTEEHYWPWSSSDSSDQSARLRQNNKLLKVQSLSVESRHDGRPSVSKSHSFGGYGGPPQNSGPLSRGDSINSTKSAGPRLFSKQDSTGSNNTPWRLSPSSSGYKTQTQSLRSDSVTPSPTGYGSDDHTPEPSVVQSPPAASCSVVWAVTDMASVPRGSVLINPQTLQPIVNQDGTIYQFDPSNLPPSQIVATGYNHKNMSVNSLHRKKFEKQKSSSNNNNNSNSNNNNNKSELQNNNNNNTNSNSNNSTSGMGISGVGGGNGGGIGGTGGVGPNSTGQNRNTNSGGANNGGGGNGGQDIPGTYTVATCTESSVENLSESSSQTVLNAEVHDDSGDGVDVGDDVMQAQHVQTQQLHQMEAKENHNHREMSDIQEEPINQYDDSDNKSVTNSDVLTTESAQLQPILKHQATSPNIPTPEPEQPTQFNEITTTNNPTIDTNSNRIQQQTIDSVTSHSTKLTTNDSKKDERKTPTVAAATAAAATSSIPIMSYATTAYQAIDGSTMFSPANSGSFAAATAYQQGADGNVYAVPQPMLYAYPPMDTEFPTYYMPMYDQTGTPRDPNTGALMPATAQAIYPPNGSATTALVPVAYPGPYAGAQIYPGQVVYSPDQFAATAPAAAGQMQQFPMTCPVGYSYPYNGYWGQTMTYYVPQPTLGANPVPSTIIPPPLTAVGNPSANMAAAMSGNGAVQQHSNNSTNSSCSGGSSFGGGGSGLGGGHGGVGGKRSSPPQHSLSSGNNSQSATPANTYQYAPAVPLSLTDPNGAAMYAISQSAVFSNMLPYPPPGTPSAAAAAAAGVLSHLPHQHSAVINNSLLTHPPGAMGQAIPIDPSSPAGGFAQLNSNGSHGNNSGTPHSAPSTPLSNPIPLPHQQRNLPLFPTPPILPNGYNAQMPHHYQQNIFEAQNGHSSGGGGLYSNQQSFDRKNNSGNSNSGGGNSKKNNNNNGNGYIQQNNRQNSYSGGGQHNQRKSNADNSGQGGNNRSNQSSNVSSQPKRMNTQTNEKSQLQSAGMVGNNGGSNNAQNSVDKNSGNMNAGGGGVNARGQGMRPKPANLDLRRSTSQRNSPSTNSAESNNNSPNSIASNHMMGIDHAQSLYMARGAPIPTMHMAAAAAAAATNDACHQQLFGAYNHTTPSMYVKYGQTFYTHPSMALPNNRRSPPTDLRPQLTPITGVYPATMVVQASRPMQPRHHNPNYKGNKSSR